MAGAESSVLLEPDSVLLEADSEMGAVRVVAPAARRWRRVYATGGALCCAALLALAGAAASPGGAGARLSSPRQWMLRAYPSSTTGTSVDVSPTAKWQILPEHSGDPKAQAGFGKVTDVKTGHVIDDFMSANPEIRKVLWDEHFDGPATVKLMEEYAKKLVINGNLDDYMKSKDCTFKETSSSGKRKIYSCGPEGQYISAKPTRDFAEENGPNNGFMRVFFHDVAAKLAKFNKDYGWDDALEAAIYDEGTDQLILVHRHYDKEWVGDPSKSPCPWILPQLHYLGVFANDIADDGHNFAVVDGASVAIPIDLDATWRGEYYSFLKVLTPAQASKVLDLNYIQIE